MAYIWINPVTDGMYDSGELNEFLRSHGYKRVEASKDWPTVVRKKYLEIVEEAEHTVMDVRCPKVRELLKELESASEVTIPEIYPILIHCSQELSRRKDLQEDKKVFTTPCQALADMGNALGLKDTWFVSWNRFIESIGSEPSRVLPKESPIPPGFFDELGFQTVSVTGEEEIQKFFENYHPDEVRLVEMLFCEKGCHNGDGIKAYES